MRRLLWLLFFLLMLLPAYGQDGKRRKSQMKDSVTLENVTVTGKSKTQRLREGTLSVQAAVLNVKLRHLDEDNQSRQKVAAYYYENLNNPLVVLPKRLPDENNVYHLFPILCEKRDELQSFLTEKGVQTLIHYPIPPHLQECYRGKWPNVGLSITEKLAKQELSLPVSQVISMEEVSEIVNLINSFH